MNLHKFTFLSLNFRFYIKATTLLSGVFFGLLSHSQISLKQVVGNNITPKSIVADGRGLFSAQNMMYKHSITLYSAQGTLLKTISDAINLNKFGFTEYEDALYRGAPVEACFTPDGKYLWVSNYAMYGPGFDKEGCDGCSGNDFDPSFLYKINTITYQIESIVKVGSVPKYLTITDNGKLLLVSNWTSSDVSIIDLDTETEIKRVKVGPRPRGIAVDSRNQKAYIAIMGSSKIAVINLLTYIVNDIKLDGRGPRHLVINSSNTHLFVAINSANKIAKINIKNKKVEYCRTNSGPRSMVLSANEQFLYVVNYFANTFQKVNAQTMEIAQTINTFQKPIGIAGDWQLGNIWVSCYSGKIQIFNDPELPIETRESEIEEDYNLPRIKLAGLILNMMEISKVNEEENILNPRDLEQDFVANTNHHFVANETETDMLSKQISEKGAYEIIVGSFSISENAERMKELLKNQKVSSKLISSSNGKMTMVSVGSCSNGQQAINLVKILKLDYDLNAWVFKKTN
ncbi:MAG: SPOR domain-containing protein [Crocinitomicaceae bacterium]